MASWMMTRTGPPRPRAGSDFRQNVLENLAENAISVQSAFKYTLGKKIGACDNNTTLGRDPVTSENDSAKIEP